MKKIKTKILLVTFKLFLLLILAVFLQLFTLQNSNEGGSFIVHQAHAQDIPPKVIRNTNPNETVTPIPASQQKPLEQTAPAGQIATPPAPQDSKLLSEVINLIIVVEKLLLSLNLPVVMIIGKLLSNDWVYLNGEIGQVLNNLWILIRNLINIAFVAVLVVVAFMAVLGIGGDKSNFAIKSILPKAVIALILVNFSFLVGKLLLDAGNLATTASFSIVQEVGPTIIGQGENDIYKDFVVCWNVDNSRNISSSGSSNTSSTKSQKCLTDKFILGFGKEEVQKIQTEYKIDDNGKSTDANNLNVDVTISPQKDFIYGFAGTSLGDKGLSLSLFNARNAMFIYSYNIFRLAELTKVVEENRGSVTTISALGINVILSIIMAGMILLLNIAMLIAFTVRMVLIWLLLVFSPILALEIVFPNIKSSIPGLKSGYLKSFAGLAFMPAICGFILSLGFLMYGTILKTGLIPPGDGTFPLGPIDIVIRGIILPGFGSIQQVILAVVMMVIVWQSVFAALKNSNEFVSKAVTGIESFGNQLAKLAKTSLSNLPIIPTPTGRVSAPALKSAVDTIQNQVKGKATTDASSFLDRSGLGEFFNVGDRARYVTDLKNSIEEVKQLKEGDRLDVTKSNKLLSSINKLGYDDEGSRSVLSDTASILERNKVNKDIVEKIRSGEKVSSSQLADALSTVLDTSFTKESIKKQLKSKADVETGKSSGSEESSDGGKAISSLKVDTTQNQVTFNVGTSPATVGLTEQQRTTLISGAADRKETVRTAVRKEIETQLKNGGIEESKLKSVSKDVLDRIERELNPPAAASETPPPANPSNPA